ncbi:hypothetical protein ACUV84_040422 [Puccinellia chinampoensis]
MKKPSCWKAGRNDKEASSSRGASSDAARRAAASAACAARCQAQRAHISNDLALIYWEVAAPLPWSDVHLLGVLHLNCRRIPVVSVPPYYRARTEEIMHRRSFLLADHLHDLAYAMNSRLWDRWFELEHDARPRWCRRVPGARGG